MPALSKFLILLAIFLSASYAHAFTSLSPVGNQVRVNHLIQFQQPMRDPTNEPSREPIREPTNDRMNDQTIHEMNEQAEVPLQQSGTHANVSRQLVPAANSEGAQVASKTAHQLPTSSHSMNNLWQCQSFVDNVSIDSWQCQMEINKVKSMKTVIVGFKADSDFSDIRSQIFLHFEADSTFSRSLSATLQQLNKMCSTFRMVACEHQCLKFDPFVSCWDLHQCNGTCNAFRMIAYLEFNRFPQNSVNYSWPPASQIESTVATMTLVHRKQK